MKTLIDLQNGKWVKLDRNQNLESFFNKRRMSQLTLKNLIKNFTLEELILKYLMKELNKKSLLIEEFSKLILKKYGIKIQKLWHLEKK